jgi:hypothetical protein
MTRLDKPSAELRARLLATAARTAPTAPGTWSRRVALAAVLALAWTVATAGLLGARADWRELPGAALAETFVVLLAVVAATAAAGLTRGRAMVGAASEPLSAAVWGGLAALLVLVLTIDARGPSTRIFAAGPLGQGWGCDGLVIAVGLPLVALGLWLLRGLTLARPGLIGGALGLAAATWAHAVVRFHCPVGGAAHALVGHLLPALPLMALGAWASKADWAQRWAARSSARGRKGSPQRP